MKEWSSDSGSGGGGGFLKFGPGLSIWRKFSGGGNKL